MKFSYSCAAFDKILTDIVRCTIPLQSASFLFVSYDAAASFIQCCDGDQNFRVMIKTSRLETIWCYEQISV